MRNIDYSFQIDDPESWFSGILQSDWYDISLSTEHTIPDKYICIEQILFKYQKPWYVRIYWSENSSEILSGIDMQYSREPILLEWANILSNHWACHWLRKSKQPIREGGLPCIYQGKIEQPTHEYAYNIYNKNINKSTNIVIQFFMDNDISIADDRNILTDETLNLNILDMMPIGSVVLNQHGEVTYINNWLTNREPNLKNKKLPLPWELVFQEGIIHDLWNYYHSYKRASYCTPWLHQIESQTEFLNGPYIISLSPMQEGATLQLMAIEQEHLNELQKIRLDATTGLYTKEVWLEKMSTHQEDGWILLLGIDKLNVINKEYGYKFGDDLIREISNRLKQHYSYASIARWNGDQIILYFNQSTYPDIRTTFESSFSINNQEVYVSGCVGVVNIFKDSRLNDIVQQLEWALDDAKSQGYNKLVIASYDTNNIHQIRRQLFHIENRLRQAVILKQFFLLYLPLIRLIDKKIIGAEALLRWQHPELGVVGPNQFISIADQNGTLESMTSWVMHTAVGLTKELRDNKINFSLSINVSTKHISSHKFYDELKELIETTKISPDQLKFEIADTQLELYSEKNKDLLDKLNTLGITFSIDDFGKNTTSIQNLVNFPIQQIKIDKSYTQALHRPQYRAITENIIKVAHELNLMVVAEGVETEEQERILIEMNCDFAQGYRYGRPMSSEQLLAVIASQ